MKNDKYKILLEKAELELANNNLIDSINLIEEVESNDVESEIILIKARIIELSKNRIRGVISEDFRNLELNKIRLAILDIISLIRKFQNSNSNGKKELVLVSELVNIIETTHSTWKAQTKLKEKLISLLIQRFNVKEFDTPYDLFSDYYSKMNKRELRIHHTIRGFTENIIFPNNLKAIKILKKNTSLKKMHHDILYLEQHLVLWKSKYDSIFIKNESICLIFVGIEEEMKFPPNLLSELKRIVKNRDEEV